MITSYITYSKKKPSVFSRSSKEQATGNQIAEKLNDDIISQRSNFLKYMYYIILSKDARVTSSCI